MTKQEQKSGRIAHLILCLDLIIAGIGVYLALPTPNDLSIGFYLMCFGGASLAMYTLQQSTAHISENSCWNDMRDNIAIATNICVFALIMIVVVINNILPNLFS